MSTKLIGGTFAAQNSRRWEPAPFHPFWFEVGTPEQYVRSTGGSTSGETTLQDRVYTTTTGASTITDFQIPVVKEERSATETVSFASSNTGVATVNSSGFVTGVSAGAVNITVSSTTCTVIVPLTIVATGGVTNYTFVRWANGSLAKAMSDRLDTLITAKTKATHAPMFTTLRSGGSLYVRNTAFLGKDLAGFTAISPWASNSLFGIGRIAITPRHVITCAHSWTHNGVTLEFVDNANLVHSRTVLRNHQLASSDMLVLTLSADLPSSIAPLKMLPANFAQKIPSLVYPTNGIADFRIPCFWIDQEKKFLVMDGGSIGEATTTPPGRRTFITKIPTNAQRLSFYELGIGGDSGHPCLFVLGNELILVEGHTSPTSGPFYSASISEINQAISIMDANAGITSGYQVQTIDVSAYPTY